MIKYKYIFLFLFLCAAFIYTGCNNNDTIAGINPNGGNFPPFKPSNPSPRDSLVVSPGTHIGFSWTGGDPDVGDTAKYDLYFGTSSPPSSRLVQGSIIAAYDLGIPASGVYFWQVIAKDTHGATATGPIWKFTISQ